MSNFQWDTDENDSWDAPETAVSASQTPTRRLQYWLWGVITLVLITATGIAVTRQLRERIAAGQAAVREDLLASITLVGETAASQDQDVFTLLLSGRDPVWANEIDDLVEQDLLFDRSLLGLTRQGEPNIGIELAPDLLSAEVSSSQAYVYEPFGQEPQRLTLTETAVYRKGENRWLLAPPEPEFWGEQQNIESERLLVNYDERDAEFVVYFSERFAADLETLCGELETAVCPEPDTLQIVASFTNEPYSLSERVINAPILTPTQYAAPRLRFTLPSPTLLGTPSDEASRKILYDIYATQLLRGVLHSLLTADESQGGFAVNLGDDCCAHALFRRGLLERELAQMGLASWPISPADYQALQETGFKFDSLTLLWQTSSLRDLTSNEQQLFAALNFLLEETAVLSMPELLTAMQPQHNYLGWLNMVAQSGSLGRNTALLEGLDQQLEFVVSQQPFLDGDTVVFPNTTLYAICNPNATFSEGELIDFVRFVNGQAPEQLRSMTEFGILEPLPDRQSMLLLTGNTDEDDNFSWQTFLLNSGEEQLILPKNQTQAFSYLHVAPRSSSLVMFHPNSGDQVETSLVDMTACDEQGCTSSNLAGRTHWSPDGRQTLIQLQSPFESTTQLVNGRYLNIPYRVELTDFLPIFFGNERGTVQSAGELGQNPFWIDNERYSFVRLTPRLFDLSARELAVFTMGASEPDHILTSERLLASLPPQAIAPANSLVRYAAAHPQNPDLLFVTAEFSRGEQDGALFLYDLQQDTVTYLSDIAPDYHILSFSPNGQYLIIEELNWEGAHSKYLILNIDTLVIEAIPFESQNLFIGGSNHEWSPADNWLALLLRPSVIGFLNVETGKKAAVSHTFGSCTDMAWLHK